MNKILHFLAALLLLSCSHETTIEKTEQDKASGLNIHLTDVQIKNAGIVARSLEEMTVSSLLKVNGQIDVPPQNIVSISVPLGGYLHSTHLLPGTRIKKGEVIALIDDQQYIQIQQDYLTAVSRLKFAETDYNRQKALNESKASSDKIFQQTEADFKSELILVKALNEKLKLIGIDPLTLNENTLSRRIRIIAPIEGYVSEVNVNIGKYVNPSDVLFELINPADIHLNLKVFEKDLDKIEIGQKLDANSNSHPEKKYSCKITLISQNFSADRSVSVHCHFENYDKSLIPGMYMNANIHTKSHSALVAPEAAVVTFEGKQFIFADRNGGNYEMLEVTVGNAEAGYIAIQSIKDKNLKVVVKGAYTLLMSLKNISR